MRKRKVKRNVFSKKLRQEVLKRQNYLCNDCGNKARNWDFDHIGSREDNSAQNCQALCLDCHRDKTNREKRQSKRR
jgi:5-methylcytosine-specific restriction endonuclease McrA